MANSLPAFDLTGKIAVVTGGLSGMGLASARAMRAAGAYVLTNARSQARLDENQALIGEAFDELLVADLEDIAHTKNFIRQVGERHGRIDVLFLNAGIADNAPLGHITTEHYERVMNTNLKSIIFAVQAGLPYFVNGTSIILNTSVNNERGMPGSLVYSASKAAVRNLARGMSAELADKGIRVNAISPGPIQTPLVKKLGIPEEMLDMVTQQVIQMVPMKRWGQPEEIANVAVFLASSASTYMMGAEIKVDGGMTSL